jgi:predicted Zn finger-like uncharacterized protein
MPIQVTCPECRATLRVRDDLAGKKVKCPRCAHALAVPGDEEPEEAEERFTEVPPAGSAPKKGARRRAEEEEQGSPEEERPARSSKYKACPQCGAYGARRVKWTFWGSFYGPAMFTHVECPDCGYRYNGRTGGSNLVPAIVFVTVPLLLILGIIGGLLFYVHRLGHF